MKTQSLMLLWCLTSTALMAAPPTVDIASLQSLSDQPVLVASAVLAEDSKSTTRAIDEASLMAAFDNHPDLVYATPMAVDATDFKSLQHHGSYLIELADGNIIEVIAERKKTVMDRMLFVSGPIAGYEDELVARATVAFTNDGMIADLQLPDGQYQIRSVAGMNWLFDPEALANVENPGTLIGDQPALHLDHDPEIGLMPGNASTKLSFTTLNVALVLSQTHGTGSSGISSALYRLELANDELERTGVNLRYHPALITRVKPSLENGLNVNSVSTVNAFTVSGTNWLDLSFSGLETSPANASSVTIHQYVLMIGPGSDTLCGVTATPPNQTGRYSVVRANGCSDSWTMAHELGHNLSCVHADGAIKSFELDPGIETVWFSMMATGFQNGPNQRKRHFTAGVDSPTDILCGGLCNVEPLAAHDCAGKMESVAPGMANQFDVINLPGSPADTFETDDDARDASNYIGAPQQHNFHTNGDIDWVRYYTTPAHITLRTTNLGPNADTCMRLYRSNATLTGVSGPAIATNCDGGPGESSLINFTQTDADVYYVRIYSQNGAVSGEGTNYTFSITGTPLTTPDDFEVDDAASQASDYLGAPQQHNFHDNGDSDWVRYYTTPAQITLRTTNLGPNADTCMRLYRSNATATGTSGGAIASNCDGGPGQSSLINFTQTDAYIYYVRIYSQNGSVSGQGTDYIFSISATPLSSVPDTYEVDDTASQASSYLGVPQTHDFHDSGDVDWVLYYAPSGFRTITATALGSNADPCIQLYRSNSTATGTSGGMLASDCDSGPGQSARIDYFQSDDYVYYVRVYHQSNGYGANTSYSLSIQ